MNDVELIRLEANNVDNKQQQTFIVRTSIKLPKKINLLLAQSTFEQAINTKADKVKCGLEVIVYVGRDQKWVLSYSLRWFNESQIKVNSYPLKLKCRTYQLTQETPTSKWPLILCTSHVTSHKLLTLKLEIDFVSAIQILIVSRVWDWMACLELSVDSVAV